MQSEALKLWNEVEKWTESGDQIVLCGDWNHDVRTPAILNQFQQYNLIPAITSRHDSSQVTKVDRQERQSIKI